MLSAGLSELTGVSTGTGGGPGKLVWGVTSENFRQGGGELYFSFPFFFLLFSSLSVCLSLSFCEEVGEGGM